MKTDDWCDFNSKAISAIHHADRISREQRLPLVGTEIFLLGIIHDETTAAASILQSLDIPLEELRETVESRITPGSHEISENSLDESCCQVLTLAYYDAQDAGQQLITTGNILTAIIDEEKGLGGIILRELGLSHENLVAKERECANETAWPTRDTVIPQRTLPSRLPLTENARRAVYYAEEAALELSASRIDTPHLLIGLVSETNGQPLLILSRRGISLNRIIDPFRAEAKPVSEVPGDMPLTPASQRVLRLAAVEARYLRDEQIDTQHLLLGLARQKKCEAAVILRGVGLNLSTLRRETLKYRNEWRPNINDVLGADCAELLKQFTIRGRDILIRAQKEALLTGAIRTEAEHILLRLLHEPEGFVTQIFDEKNLTCQQVFNELTGKEYPQATGIKRSVLCKTQQWKRKSRFEPECPPFSPGAKRIMEIAIAQANNLRNKYAGGEHLLLALLQDKVSAVATLLGNYGLNLDDTREKVENYLHGK